MNWNFNSPVRMCIFIVSLWQRLTSERNKKYMPTIKH